MVYGDYHHVSSPANDMGHGWSWNINQGDGYWDFIEEESTEIQSNGDQDFGLRFKSYRIWERTLRMSFSVCN